MLDPKEILPVQRQCDLLQLCRSSLYYRPVEKEDRYRQIKELMMNLWQENPSRGARYLCRELEKLRERVSRKKVRGLMKELGIRALCPQPNLSKPNKQHKKYPYLLRGVVIERPNQVWSADITYIRLSHGFVYLVAIIDWYSRAILSWRLSSTLDSDFCVEALEEALRKYGLPEIFNTDQGSQFTSEAFLGVLEKHEAIRISMDGVGRALDNVYIERFWRTLKYEYVYLWKWDRIRELRIGLGNFITDYNHRREHSALGKQTPWNCYSLNRWCEAA
jgi:putative transposase